MKDGNWRKFYSNFSYLDVLRDNSVHAYYLFRILMNRPKKALEVGCGTGSQSIFLSHFVSEVCGVDKDEELIGLAKKLRGKRNKKTKFVHGDAFNLPLKDKSFDLCFSQGFFEHFSDAEIISLCNEQLRVADKIIFSVPSDNYFCKDFGNERLLSPQRWENILEKMDEVKINVKYYPFDLGLRSKIRIFKKTHSLLQMFTKPLHVIGEVKKLK
ncbi:MAG: methyltransferase domain-containing protein [Candidatus Omnitrophica bacterium]|nr:methyltransferase domain-containing protein [Candidatus Omnitrophota bacterium]